MDLRGYLRALRRSWWIIVVALVLGTGVGAFFVARTPDQYASSVTFFVKTPSTSSDSQYTQDQFGQKRINTYVQLVQSDRFAKTVISATQQDITPQDLIDEISARADLNTVLLNVTVTDESKARSLQLATAISTEFPKLVSQFETPPGGSTPSVYLEISSGPTLTDDPVAPKPVLYIGLGLAIGLLVGLVLAVMRELLDTSVRTSESLRHVADYPMLGVIGFDSTARKSPLIVDSHAKSTRAEAFRQLRTNLQFVDVDAPVRVIVVTSSVPGEGKSTTAVNLAVTFAEAGRKVLLIEGDLRRPKVGDYLGLEGSVGLTNVLAGQVRLADVLQPWGKGGLTVLPSGSIPPNPSELLGSHNMIELLDSLKNTFDTIILDTPPLLPVTDAAVAAAHADGAVLVVRQGKTTRGQVASAMRALEAVDARIVGTVLNMARLKGSGSYSYTYGRGYGDQPGTRPQATAHPVGQPAVGADHGEVRIAEKTSHSR